MQKNSDLKSASSLQVLLLKSMRILPIISLKLKLNGSKMCMSKASKNISELVRLQGQSNPTLQT